MPPLVWHEWSLCIRNGPDNSYNQLADFSLLVHVTSSYIATLSLLALDIVIGPSETQKLYGSASRSFGS